MRGFRLGFRLAPGLWCSFYPRLPQGRQRCCVVHRHVWLHLIVYFIAFCAIFDAAVLASPFLLGYAAVRFALAHRKPVRCVQCGRSHPRGAAGWERAYEEGWWEPRPDLAFCPLHVPDRIRQIRETLHGA